MKAVIKTSGAVSEQELSDIIRSSARGEVIYSGRNKLIACRHNGQRMVLKHFSSGMKNRLVYSIFKSKARRSFEHATVLAARGIDTPGPVGYAEYRSSFNILADSYYICEYDDKISLVEAVERFGRPCLAAFAAFVSQLHDRGILHKDLNNTNVRVAPRQDGFVFSLIDLNRMTIYPAGKQVPLKERFKNLCRFSSYDDDFVFFLREYLHSSHMSETLMSQGIAAKRRHDAHVDFKKKLKHPFRKNN